MLTSLPHPRGMLHRLIPVLLLAACASPHPAFMGDVKSEHQTDHVTATAFVTPTRVQVIRTSRATRRTGPAITADLHAIARIATGCENITGVSLDGNTVLTASYSCR